MDIFWIRVVSQLGVYITFAFFFAWSWRRGPREWVPLLGAVGYAVLFEHFNMLRYAHARGGYHYHRASWLLVAGDVPLYIPLAWSFILSTSRHLTDRLRMVRWARPFSDALLALLIDLSLDAVAIRLHFWFWHGVGLNDGFFGVPADNFLGWLLVTFTFSLLTRPLWEEFGPQRKNVGEPSSALRHGLLQFLVVPPFAYGSYLALEAIVHEGYHIFQATSLRGQLGVLAGVLLAFLTTVLVGIRMQTRLSSDTYGEESLTGIHNELMLHGPRQVFHLFGRSSGYAACPPRCDLPRSGLWRSEYGLWKALSFDRRVPTDKE